MFKPTVFAKYEVLAVSRPPAPDYPPANIKSMVDQCEAKGRADLGEKIMMQWASVCDRYPAARINWGAAVKIGGASIKKHVFGGKEFVDWFGKQVEGVSPEETEVAKSTPIMAVPKGAPAIAIPTDKETPEQWSEEAKKTREILVQVRAGFAEASQFIVFFEKEVSELRRKIKDYSPGGSKHMTKTGKPHKFSSSVPKWEEQLKVLDEQMKIARENMLNDEKKVVQSAHAYEHAPVTTVAYEVNMQQILAEIQKKILKTKDVEKQLELLVKFNETRKRLEVKAETEEVIAGAGEVLVKLWAKMSSMWAGLLEWIKGLSASVEKFSQLANIRY
jgi:hypothetical protein